MFTLGAKLSAPRCCHRLFSAGRHYSCPAAPNMGECFTSITLPSPTYMCTPPGKPGYKTPNRTHDIDALEILRTIVFKDRCVLHRILIGTRSSVDIARIR